MNFRPHPKAGLLVSSVAILAGFALAASAALPPVEKLLPDDTLGMVTAPDFTKAREIYLSAPQSQMWNDPAMKPFKDQFMSKLTENLIQPLEKDLGIKFEDYTNLLQGQITLAVTQNGWPNTTGAKPGVLLLLDTRNQSGQLTKSLADLRKKWLAAGKSLRTEKVRNTDFAVVAISDKDMPRTLKKFSGPDAMTDADESATNAPKKELYIGQAESLLIVGTAPKPIEKVLVHVSGGEMPSLGDLAVYEANRLLLFRDTPLYGWVNIKSLLDLWDKQQAKESSDTPDPFAMLNPTKILSAIGLSSLKTIAFSVQISNDASTVQVFASMPEANRQGIFKVIPGEAKDSSPPSFVPADAVKFQRSRIDGKKAWDTLQKVLADISPSAKGAISFMIDTANAVAKEKDPDFDINKNLFGNLGDDFIGYEKAPRGTSEADLKAPPSLFLIGSPNPDQVVAAFKYVFLLTNPQGGAPKEREFLGRKIYTVPMPGAAAAFGGDAPGARSMNYAASSGYVAFSSDASMIEEYLRSGDSQQKALRETPGLTDTIAKAGGSSTGLLGYENQAETTRATFESLRNSSSTNQAAPGPAAMMFGMSGMPSATGTFKDWMDFSLLPPFDKVSKYFGVSVYTLSSTPDGILLKMYTPVPAGLRK